MRLQTDYHDWIYFLNLFSEYDSSVSDTALFRYDFSSHGLQALAKYAEIENMIGSKDSDFKKAVSIMKWVNTNLSGDGMCVPPDRFDAISVLQKTKEFGLKSNCWMHAVVMTELCLAAGFYARMVRCLPIDLEYSDCQCVTTIYLREYQKWVVFDPSNNAYYLDQNMMPMDLPALRRSVATSKPIYIPMASRATTQRLIQYFAKTLFRFECDSMCGFGNESALQDRTFIALNPIGFKLTNNTFHLTDRTVRMIYIYSEKDFWKPPY